MTVITTEPSWPTKLPILKEDLNNRLWGLWGSAARGELTDKSDIDLLTWAREAKSSIPKSVTNWHQKRPIDLLQIYVEPTLVAYGSGIDYYAIYSARCLQGNIKLKKEFVSIQQQLYLNETIRAREFLHILLSYGMFGKLRGKHNKNNMKTIAGGTSSWAALSIAYMFRHPEALQQSPDAILMLIANDTNLKYVDLAKARSQAIEIRNSASTDLTYERKLIVLMWKEAAIRLCKINMSWIQSNAGAPAEIMEQVFRLVFNASLNIPEPGRINNSVQNYLKVLLCDSANKLDELASPSSDWWSTAAITVNPHTASYTLDRLAFPPSDWEIAGWRLQRGRIVNHPNTTRSTLEKMANTKTWDGTFPYSAANALIEM